MRIAAVVPAYNEVHSIRLVVNELKAVASENNLAITVVVVNDCSTDGTGALADQLPCLALHLPVNLGIGGAVQTGFRYALENNFDYAIQIDGDGQHPATEIPKLVETAEKNKLDVTIGSRFLDREGFQSSGLRRTGINYFSWLIFLLTGIRVMDTTSGFRLLNRKGLLLVNDYYPDEYPEPEAIVLFARQKLTIGEVAVKMRERLGGTSSIGFRKSIYYIWKVTLACVFTRIRRLDNPGR
ncbi:MAG TPA: glycosyltransferase family 2 protein [Bacteroidia bacterium]|nr:glycosyltransferase family 2 protein [Bacteroidia bacterium]